MDSIIDNVRYENRSVFRKKISDRERERLLDLIDEFLPHVDIYKIKKLRNPYLYTAFLLKQQQYPDCEVIQLIHSTAANNVPSIKDENLNWRYVKRSKYGYGVSFSYNADYADFHSSKETGEEKVFIVCDVLINRKKIVTDNNDRCPSRMSYDTYVSQNGLVWVKFDDFTYYPKYALYYDKPPRHLSNFHHKRRH